MSQHATPPTPPPPARLRSPLRVRVGMYLAFVTIALAVLAQGWGALRREELRSVDAEILDKAGMQRAFAQQIGRLAALIGAAGADPAERVRQADALGVMLAQSGADALAMNELLARQMARSAQTAQQLGPPFAAWDSAREKLWYRTEVMLRHVDAQDEDAVQRSAQAVQAEVAPATLTARRLSSTLRALAEQRALLLQREVRWGVGLTLALLVALALLLVEPTARSVQRHARRLAEQATELQRLAMVAEQTSALVLVTDRDDRIVWANRAFTQQAGWTLDEVRGVRPAELMHCPHADPAVLQRVRDAIAEGRGVRDQWLSRMRDGRDLWMDVDLRPMPDGQGGVAGYVSVSTDVSVRMAQQAKLHALWSVLPAGVIVRAASGEVVEANRAAERLLGLNLAQMQKLEPLPEGWELVHEDGTPYEHEDKPGLRTLRDGQGLQNQMIGVRLPGGEQRWLLSNTEPQRDAHGVLHGVITCISDITERRRLQERLSDSARTDALTRLPNRAVVMERLQRAIAHAHRHPAYGFAVMFMDFDRFKQVNDTQGHAAGDELLRQIAQRLLLALRPGDALARVGPAEPDGPGLVAARLGGDEFVVVLEGVNDSARAGAIAQRLLHELAEPYVIGCNPLQSSVSIGVVLCTGAAGEAGKALSLQTTADDVLRNADTAMYEAKRAGRGRWVMFDDSMHERVVRALALETDLRRALKEDELFVVYQPVMDLVGGAMVGVEALVRWRHPERGLVGPVEFIGVAEECGLIDAVGEVVLRQACAQFMRWQDTLGELAPRQLAVNLSRAQLERAGLVDDVRRVLADAGMPAQQLQLEVTESLAGQGQHVQATLRALKNLGVKLALDDFGTGYSSLACLHQLPVDTVKVDRSFVEHAETVEYHRVLIEATIRVARTLGMTTVAEGIETEGQAELMLALDCDRGQGYLYSRPVEAPELERWVRARAPAEADTV